MISVQDMGRYKEGYSSSSESKINIRPGVVTFQDRNFFTLHSSSFRVMCGRLGEVESLVGDCRTPPPGNPRQPTVRSSTNQWIVGLRKDPFTCNGFIAFIPRWQKNGRVFLPMYKHHSFIKNIYPYNLKKLIQSQYFKNNCSYYSCAVACTVLEFVNSHYHIYGFRLVGLPSIAITNVLVI